MGSVANDDSDSDLHESDARPRTEPHPPAQELAGALRALDDDGLLAGRYRLLSKLGEGAMGAVYLAEHVILGRKLAIKLLKPELCNDPRLVQRFYREAVAAGSVNHPNVVRVLDAGAGASGDLYYAMELLAGDSVAAALARSGPWPWPRAVAVLRQAAAALQAVHDAGIVHRDVKPANLMLVPGDDGAGERLKVVDFGIAQTGALGKLTTVGMVIGTPQYMSPEQSFGQDLDARGDIYALGTVTYEVLAGRAPFASEQVHETLRRLRFEPPPALPAQVLAAAPPELLALVDRMLAKDPDDRPQAMREVEAALAALPGPSRVPTPTPLAGPILGALSLELPPTMLSVPPKLGPKR